jgi:Glu-tRNA(Gln) amidotransferase subunit E-like FAD-binding protein
MEIDFDKVGFKAGLEIHQQLDTHKLFCNCPSVLRSDEPDYEVERRLHVVAGESGKVDVAVKHEAGLNKKFVYQGYNENVCLVDLDEEPPHEINSESLKIALQIAILLNCKIVPLSQIMRKTVLDGSNTGGFQRTVMIAYDGFVETSRGKVGIDALFLEEDSARPVFREEDKVVYRLDRLGIPLVEIATRPDIKDAEHAKETALKIGEILRSCKVRRGIGTIRQDVNISIKGTNRVELKGFQDPKMMIKTVENEVERQLEFVKKKRENNSEVRNVLADGTSEFMRPMPGASRMYPETDLPLLKIHRDLINEVKKDLPKLRSVVEEELKKQGLDQEMIKLLFKQNRVEEFKELLGVYDKSMFVARAILIFPKGIAKRKKMDVEKVWEIVEDNLGDVLSAVSKKKISEKEVEGVLEKIVEGEDLKSALKIEKADVGDVEEKIMKLIKSKPGLNPNAYMGLVMKEFGGKVDGKEAMKIIGKFVR